MKSKKITKARINLTIGVQQFITQNGIEAKLQLADKEHDLQVDNKTWIQNHFFVVHVIGIDSKEPIYLIMLLSQAVKDLRVIESKFREFFSKQKLAVEVGFRPVKVRIYCKQD